MGMGQLCTISAPDGGRTLLAEVVALAPGRVVLMPFDSAVGVSTGWRVQTCFQLQHGVQDSASAGALIDVGEGLQGASLIRCTADRWEGRTHAVRASAFAHWLPAHDTPADTNAHRDRRSSD